MNQKERIILAAMFAIIALLVIIDLVTDSNEGVIGLHIFVEGLIALSAVLGIIYLLKTSMDLKHQLEKEINEFSEFKKEAILWREESKKYVEGLSNAIDQQLTKWNLTVAEKEVAFLLLKGLSLKEVADIRNTTEKTARVQSMAIYTKSGLSGRSELSAFFLEDLLLPQAVNSEKKIAKLLITQQS